MNEKDAFFLLFVKDFGSGTLFKSQIDLIHDLMNDRESYFYFNKQTEKADFEKGVNRLKAYISQLFSEGSKRVVTVEFIKSLQAVIEKRLKGYKYNIRELIDDIILDLREKNLGNRRHQFLAKTKIDSPNDFFIQVLDSNYISIFTARDVVIEYTIMDKTFSLASLLIDNFFESLKNGTQLKKYRFNFPLEQTCILFWRGLKQEVLKYISENKESISEIIAVFNPSIQKHFSPLVNKSNVFQLDDELESSIVKLFFSFIITGNIVKVFYLNSPVYVTPSIALDPNDSHKSTTYLLLQSTSGEDRMHKLTNHENVFWRFFVWENLKLNNQGKEIIYKDDF